MDVSPERDLRTKFDVVERHVSVAGRETVLLHPRSAEALIDEAAFDEDERLPYWADLWPSAIALAERVASMDGAGRSCLELGCGMGLVSVAAARAGFAVAATDYYADALAFTQLNVRRNADVDAETFVLDWREPPRDLARADLVVASDVLYERPYASLVARLIALTLRRGGTALVADPGRIAAPAFIDAARALGLGVAGTTKVPYEEKSIRQTISIYELKW
jgi:predicted nicotinamide N-methyase